MDITPEALAVLNQTDWQRIEDPATQNAVISLATRLSTLNDPAALAAFAEALQGTRS